jgi:alpha-pyrone synthase
VNDQKTHLVPNSRDGILLWYGEGAFCSLARDLPKQVESSVKVSVPPVLAANDTSVDDLAFWIVHPGGPKIILAVEAAFNLETKVKTKHSWGVLKEYGNMISASTLFIAKRTMEEAEQTGKTGKAMLVAFAPGVTTEFVIFERH